MPKREKHEPVRRRSIRREAGAEKPRPRSGSTKGPGRAPAGLRSPSPPEGAGPPLVAVRERWVATFRELFDWFALEMLRSEEQRALAIFEIDPEIRTPFAQYQMEPCGILLDLPTSSVEGEVRARLLEAGLALRRAADVPELRPSEEDVSAHDPLRKEYSWGEAERASRELARLLFDFFGAPSEGPIFLTWWAEGGIATQRIVLCHGAPAETVH